MGSFAPFKPCATSHCAPGEIEELNRPGPDGGSPCADDSKARKPGPAGGPQARAHRRPFHSTSTGAATLAPPVVFEGPGQQRMLPSSTTIASQA